MIYVWHHVIALVLAAGAAIGLERARWTHRSPRVAVLLWLATAISAVTGAVGVLLGAGLQAYRLGIVPALGALASDVVGGAHQRLTWAHLLAVGAGVLLAAAAVAVQLRSSWEAQRHRARHHLLLRLVARPDADGRALVLEHPVAAAYYVPGQAGSVVVSTGALAALTATQLDAVLAHERAHARGRHHLVIAPFHTFRRALPCGVTERAAACVELLVEMCADDRAAREHGSAAVITALHRFRDVGGRPVPPGALAVADRAIEMRVHRLREARPAPNALVRVVAVAAALAVATTPVSLFVLPL